MINTGHTVEVPQEILSSPSLLFLYYRIEQILGIRAGSSALVELNDYLEKTCGASFTENPAAYERLLASRERIFEISNIITINETYFFREGAHFNLLAALLPQLIKQNRTIQICSAATSTGCEAYSIAMMLDNYTRDKSYFDYEIDAFDVSAEAIETAQKGRYTANTLRNDGSAWKYIFDLYLIQENDEYVVAQNIRKKVRFFPHNIMRGFEKQYDIIFFRNALIYFTPKNRLEVINNLAKSLFDNGFLFLGMSETSSVQHPLLVSRYSSDVFYFQKTANAVNYDFKNENLVNQKLQAPVPAEVHELKQKNISHNNRERKSSGNNAKHVKPAVNTASVPYKQKELPVSITEISAILETDEGRINAKKVLDIFADDNAKSLSGGELAASVLFFLNMQDYNSAAPILSYLENCNSGVFTRFLQGEYYYLQGNAKKAEHNFQEAAIKDKIFWPAFYRIAALAANGNRTRYEYKIKKAIESIELSQNHREMRFECFMGGFSPDYFRRILEKKLSLGGESYAW